VIWIDPGSEAVNWRWYFGPAYRDQDYLPAARGRPAGDAPATVQWRQWQEQLREACGRPRPASSRRRPVLGR
jgi:hypothetical protein